MSRNIVGGVNILMHREILPRVDYFPWMGACVWGVVMYLFEVDRSCLQPSLSSSMQFLYKDSDLPVTRWT